MLRLTITAAALLAIAANCHGQKTPELGLFMHFDSKPSPDFLAGMEAELNSILAPTALQLEWLTDGEPPPKPKTWLRAVFIRFHGSCGEVGEPGEAADGDRITLAETEVSDGTILPYTETDCDRLRAFIAKPEDEVGGSERLGVAMARVIAHELYHVLLQTTEHSKRGIARAVHTPAALLGRSLRFESGELEEIRRRYSLPQNTSFSASWSWRGP